LRVACRPLRQDLSPGIAFFVSGMYRGDRRQPAPLVECRAARLEKTDECSPRGLLQGAANGCFILAKRTVEHSGRDALRPLQTACRSPFDRVPVREKSRIEARVTRFGGAVATDIGTVADVRTRHRATRLIHPCKYRGDRASINHAKRAAKTACTPPAYRGKKTPRLAHEPRNTLYRFRLPAFNSPAFNADNHWISLPGW